MKLNENKFESFICEYLEKKNAFLKRENKDYDKQSCCDFELFYAFLKATQAKQLNKLLAKFASEAEAKAGLKRALSQASIHECVAKGVECKDIKFKCFFNKPANKDNEELYKNYLANTASYIRQLKYSQANENSIDIVLFINGVAILSVELKNEFTKQTFKDAIKQYKKDRDPKEPLLRPNKLAMHMALDHDESHFCTALKGEKSLFMPFNKGLNDGKAYGEMGAGNPINPNGAKTAYIWEEVFTKDSLLSLLYDFVYFDKDKKTLIFPRYHQYAVINALKKDILEKGVGQRYLVQHSAGSGKSNSISWLASVLKSLHFANGKACFDNIIIITDRRALDRQIEANLKKVIETKGILEHAINSKRLKELLASRGKIIVSTIQKFVFIEGELKKGFKGSCAVLIDEAHSSQSGESAKAVNAAISEYESKEEGLEAVLDTAAAERRFAKNASYFAFSATPKPKTLESFGCFDGGRAAAFHTYSMKQAIEEGFILDVLANYTTYKMFYDIIKLRKSDLAYAEKRAKKAIAKYIYSHDMGIGKKAGVIAQHFKSNVAQKIGGRAKAMVVCSSVQNAITYYTKLKQELASTELGVVIAFSGTHKYEGEEVTESTLNNAQFPAHHFSEDNLAKIFKDDAKIRFLVVADKYQTGFDEPLLFAMYVDKPLAGVSCVQTLSRLNRTMKGKDGTLVLDFCNELEDIKTAFEPFYKASFLDGKSDENQLYKLVEKLRSYELFSREEEREVLELLEADEERLHGVLDTLVAKYEELDDEGKLSFYKNATSFKRAYNFQASILPYKDTNLEALHIFLKLYVSKLALPKSADASFKAQKYISLEDVRLELQESKASVALDEAQAFTPASVGDGNAAKDESTKSLDELVEWAEKKFGGLFEKKEKEEAKSNFELMMQRIRENPDFETLMDGDANTQGFKNLVKKHMMQTFEKNIILGQYFKDQAGWNAKIYEGLSAAAL